MGWSESYFEDMQKEAQAELRRRSVPLTECMAELHDALDTYREFVKDADELASAIERLQGLLQRYRAT